METLSFKHSGRLGDIIYALPLLKKMTELQNRKADFYILNDEFYDAKISAYHPGEGVTVSQKLFDYISPLLAQLAYINKVVYCSSNEAPVDSHDLDSFKKQRFNLTASGNQIWYRKAFSVPVPFEEKWLTLKDEKVFLESKSYNLLVGKTNRFYNKSVNYGFLDEIENVGFIGLEMEYEDFVKRNNLKKLQYVPTKDALEVAGLMLKTNLYIGNQSLGFAIAEGLKIPRAVEVFEPVPVVIPIGGICIEYVNTHQLLKFLSENVGIKLNGKYEDFSGGFVECVLTEKPPKLSKRIKAAIKKIRLSSKR